MSWAHQRSLFRIYVLVIIVYVILFISLNDFNFQIFTSSANLAAPKNSAYSDENTIKMLKEQNRLLTQVEYEYDSIGNNFTHQNLFAKQNVK